MEHRNIRVAAEVSLTTELREVFAVSLVEQLLRDGQVETEESARRASLEGHAFRVTEQLSSKLYALCREVCDTLQFSQPVEFFILNDPEINASAIPRIDDDQSHFVLLNAATIQQLDPPELKFIIGHEIGHLICESAGLSRVVHHLFPDGTPLPVLFQQRMELWIKLTELSADRFGYIASPQLDVCQSVFFKLSAGVDPQRIGFEPSAYMEEIDRTLAFLRETMASNAGGSHPVNPIRLKALQHFSKSTMLQHVLDSTPAPEDKVLATAIEDLVHLLVTYGNSQLDQYRRKFIGAGGLLVAGVDNETSHAEVERIVDALASCTSFPTRFLNELAEAANLVQEFEDAVDGLLSINPGERYGLFDTLAWIATSDRQLHQAEIDILYEIGQKSLGFSKTEAAQRLAETIQRTFLPWAL